MEWGGCLYGIGRLTVWCGYTLDVMVRLSGEFGEAVRTVWGDSSVWRGCLDGVGRMSGGCWEAVCMGWGD